MMGALSSLFVRALGRFGRALLPLIDVGCITGPSGFALLWLPEPRLLRDDVFLLPMTILGLSWRDRSPR